MHPDTAVADHYGNPHLEKSIFDALVATGHNLDSLAPDDLLAVDEFHVGGAQATRDVAVAAGITAGTSVLDIGSGIGGPARMFAHHFGATVVGVDVTPEFVRTATSLTERVGLTPRVAFVEGSGLHLPFVDDQFDVATLLHVGMNIADKPTLFAQAARVVKPGGTFVVYDIMVTGEGEAHYPLPWAAARNISFLASPDEYLNQLETAGFTVKSRRTLRDAGIRFLESGPEPDQQPSPLGMHLVLGPDARTRIGNLLAALKAGVMAPVEMTARLR